MEAVPVVHQSCPFLKREAHLSATHAHMEYCNAVYKGLPLKTIQKLELVQNGVAYAVVGLHIKHLCCMSFTE